MGGVAQGTKDCVHMNLEFVDQTPMYTFTTLISLRNYDDEERLLGRRCTQRGFSRSQLLKTRICRMSMMWRETKKYNDFW
jgi:hypothetical protein